MSGYDRWREPAEPSWAIEPTHEWRPQFPGQRYPGDIGLEHLAPPTPRGRATVVGRAEVRPVSPAPVEDDAYPADGRRGSHPVSPAGPDARRGGYPVSPAPDDRRAYPDRNGREEPRGDGRRSWSDRHGPHPDDRYDPRGPGWAPPDRGQPAARRDDRPDQRWVRPHDAAPQRPVSPAPEPGWLPEPDEFPHRHQPRPGRPEQRWGAPDGPTPPPHGPVGRPGFDPAADRGEPAPNGRPGPGVERRPDRRDHGSVHPADRRDPGHDGRGGRHEPGFARPGDGRDPGNGRPTERGFDGAPRRETDPRRDAAARAETYRDAPEGPRRPVDGYRPGSGRYEGARPAAFRSEERWEGQRAPGDPVRPRAEEWPVIERRARTEPPTHRPDEWRRPPLGPDGRPVRPADEPATRYDARHPGPVDHRYDGPPPEPTGPRYDGPRPDPTRPRPEPVGPPPESVAPRQEPSRPRQEPITPRQESGGPRLEPAGSRPQPPGPRAEPGRPDEGRQPPMDRPDPRPVTPCPGLPPPPDSAPPAQSASAPPARPISAPPAQPVATSPAQPVSAPPAGPVSAPPAWSADAAGNDERRTTGALRHADTPVSGAPAPTGTAAVPVSAPPAAPVSAGPLPAPPAYPGGRTGEPERPVPPATARQPKHRPAPANAPPAPERADPPGAPQPTPGAAEADHGQPDRPVDNAATRGSAGGKVDAWFGSSRPAPGADSAPQPDGGPSTPDSGKVPEAATDRPAPAAEDEPAAEAPAAPAEPQQATAATPDESPTPSDADTADQAGEAAEDEPAEVLPADPEQALAAFRWQLHPETLREEAPDPAALRQVRDGLTTKLGSALDNRSRARLLSLRSVASRILGDLDDALADARLALTYAEATGELRRSALARARLAEVLRWRGEYPEADRLFAEANSPELPDRLRAALHEHAGRCCYDQGRLTEACLHFERALDLRQGEDVELGARTVVALDAVAERAAAGGFGPKPRSREVVLGHERYPVPTFDEDQKLWGYADAEGNLVVEHRYAEVQPFREGLAWVRRPEASRWTLIDTTGAALIEANNGYRAVGSFSEGLAWVSMDGKGRWMAVDPTNIVRIPPGYEDTRPFRGGLAAVRQNGGWGAVDRSGQVVVPTRYHGFTTALADGRYVDGFTEEGLAGVELAGRQGVVDRTGRVLVTPAYPALVVHPVAFLVSDDSGRWGALDRRGEPLIDPVHPGRDAVVAEIEQLLADTSPVL